MIRSLKRRLRNAAKAGFRRGFELGQHLGVDILPRHFYSSIPDFREMRRSDAWRRPYDMTGVAGTDLDEQVRLLNAWLTPPVVQRLSNHDVYGSACAANSAIGYGAPDADVLFAFIMAARPQRVVQIGCGVSTAVILAAARAADHTVQLTCVDPYPTEFLERAAERKSITLLPQKAEAVPTERLRDLDAGDLLFVDSSHTTKPGSDVHHLILRVLPRLETGVFVHFHDVTFPYDYGPNIFAGQDLFFGVEPVVLHAYLIHNSRCAIRVSMSMLHHDRPDDLARLVPHYEGITADRGINPPGTEGRSPSATYLQMR
jgi:hypothetical protein